MKKKYTVSILGTLPPIRALSSYCFELSTSLANLCPVEFISFKSIYPGIFYPGGNLKDDDSYPQITSNNINIKRRLTWYNPLSWIMEGFSAKGDLLHAQWWSTPLFLIYLIICTIFKLKNKPIVFTVHNVFPHERSFIYIYISKLLYKFGDHFIVHSDINKTQMTNFYNITPDKITVIPHGSLDFHVKTDSDRESIRNEFGILKENLVILLFGAVRSYKGIETAIKALADIIDEFPESKLFIAGKLWESWSGYEKLINDLNLNDNILLHLEYIDSADVHKFFEAADLCLFPYNHFDSQSGAAAAAMSFRKPMIVSNVGGLPELIKDKRFIIPPGDKIALANALKTVFRNPDILCSMERDTEEQSEKFSWSVIAKTTETIYKKLLQHKVQNL